MKRITPFFLLCMVTLLFNCSKNSADTNVINATTGGTVTSSDAVATITIPANALSENTKISITPNNTHPSGNVGNVYDFGPNGTLFSSPVTITFKYNDADVTGLESDLQLAYLQNNNWITVPSTVDQTNNKVTAAVNHFTPYAIVSALIGSWVEVSEETTNCGVDNSPLTNCTTACSTLVFTGTAITSTKPGTTTANFTYTVSGSTLNLTPATETTITFVISGTNLTTTSTDVAGCQKIVNFIKI